MVAAQVGSECFELRTQSHTYSVFLSEKGDDKSYNGVVHSELSHS